jgi:hypothetical protein
MTLRAVLVAILVAVCAPSWAAPGARPTPKPKLTEAPMTFYVVKGAPGSCGPGCDSWIAAEGTIDSGAAPRFRKFLRQAGNRNLPIYFSSPGGNLDQALAIGANLREKPVVARVARTVVGECGFEAQDSDVCVKLKQSGRVLHGDLFTRGAICNSACPYLLLGAANREVAPDAILGVHSPKVVLRFHGGAAPTPQMRSAATQRGLDRADRMLSSYIVRMGADIGLLGLVHTIKFEQIHVLTREEMARFGIDRRERAETPWQFERGSRSMVSKMTVQRNESDQSYRLVQWRLICLDTDRFELDFQRPAATSAVFPTVLMSNGGATSLYLKSIPFKSQGLEFWGLPLNEASVRAFAEVPQFELTETSQGGDGRRVARTSKFSSEGLAGALDSLLATCPQPKTMTIGSRDGAAK